MELYDREQRLKHLGKVIALLNQGDALGDAFVELLDHDFVLWRRCVVALLRDAERFAGPIARLPQLAIDGVPWWSEKGMGHLESARSIPAHWQYAEIPDAIVRVGKKKQLYPLLHLARAIKQLLRSAHARDYIEHTRILNCYDDEMPKKDLRAEMCTRRGINELTHVRPRTMRRRANEKRLSSVAATFLTPYLTIPKESYP
jgi:hypothetical protein